MGLFSRMGKQPVIKEIEINTAAEPQDIIEAINSCGMKAKMRGEEINVRGKIFSPFKVSGTVMYAEGVWVGTIIITASPVWAAKVSAALTASIKKLGK